MVQRYDKPVEGIGPYKAKSYGDILEQYRNYEATEYKPQKTTVPLVKKKQQAQNVPTVPMGTSVLSFAGVLNKFGNEQNNQAGGIARG